MKVNKLFFFFSSECFLKEWKTYSPCFYRVIETAVKVWQNWKKLWKHSTGLVFPQYFSFSQTFTRVSIKQLDYELKKRSLSPAAALPQGEAQSFPCCRPSPGGSTVFPLLPPCPRGKHSLCPCCCPAPRRSAVFEPAAVLTRARLFIKNMRVLFWAHPFPPLSSTICYLLTSLISRRFY